MFSNVSLKIPVAIFRVINPDDHYDVYQNGVKPAISYVKYFRKPDSAVELQPRKSKGWKNCVFS
jgi:hypothetical protein